MKKTLIAIIIIGLVLLISGKIIMLCSQSDDDGISTNNFITDGSFDIIKKEFDGVDSIDLELGIYSVAIQSNNTIKNVRIKAKKPIVNVNGADIDKLEINFINGRLTIKQKRSRRKDFKILNFDDYKGELQIEVPAGNVLDNIDIENGVGKIELNDISVNNLDIDCGTSSVEGRNLKMSECSISGGVGSVKLYDILTDKLKIDSGTGSAHVSGDIMKEAKVSTGTSSVSFELYGGEKDYNFDIETGLGSIKIYKNEFKREATINNKSNRNIEINAGLGSINIKTE